MVQVFISYSRESQDSVETLVEDLQTLGHDPWFDQVLTGAHEWWNEVLGRIRACDLFIAHIKVERNLAENTVVADLFNSTLL